MIRRRAALVAALGLFVAAGSAGSQASAAPAEVDPALINKAVVWVDVKWPGVVTVPFKDGSTKQYRSSVTSYCTGFFISPDADVATAGHCVTSSRSKEIALITKVIEDNNLNVTSLPSTLTWPVTFESPAAYVGQPNVSGGGMLAGKESVLAQIVEHQPFENGDNALLRISNMTVDSHLRLSSAKPKALDKVSSVGFPGSVDKVTDVRRQPASITTGTVSSLSTTDRGVPVIQINAAVSSGMSGGPTVNDAGEVIGINSFGVKGETQPFNFVTDTDVLRKFMTSNGVSLGTAQVQPKASTSLPAQAAGDTAPTATSSSSVPWLLWAGALAVFLVLLAVIGVLVLQLRKSRAPAGPTVATGHGTTVGPPPQS